MVLLQQYLWRKWTISLQLPSLCQRVVMWTKVSRIGKFAESMSRINTHFDEIVDIDHRNSVGVYFRRLFQTVNRWIRSMYMYRHAGSCCCQFTRIAIILLHETLLLLHFWRQKDTEIFKLVSNENTCLMTPVCANLLSLENNYRREESG